MNPYQFLFLAILFAVVSCAAYLLLRTLARVPVQLRLRRLAEETSSAEHRSEHVWRTRVVELAGPMGRLALPSEGWEHSNLRVRFMNAGFRGAAAPAVFFAAKTLLTFALPILFLSYIGLIDPALGARATLLLVLLCAAAGYYLPSVVLAFLVKRRQRELFENFPDALDLMTVCVEAGLSLDAVIARTGDEMRINSEALADELHLVMLELRAGASREQALRNLALRTGVEEIDSLCVMLIQSDRFGTSIADSLRVHSESLRSKRRLRAEEAAAKIPTKMLFPMIFFIFPSLLLVLLGPAFISIQRLLMPTITGD